MYKDSETVIGYSGFILFEECYEYNENACFIADTESLSKQFMDNCGYSSSDYRIDTITFDKIMSDYGCSCGEYAMEPVAFSKFKQIAENNSVKFRAVKFEFDPTLTVVNVKGTR